MSSLVTVVIKHPSHFMLLKLRDCSDCCIPSTIIVNNTRSGNSQTVGAISEKCVFKSKTNYVLRPLEALSGLHLNVTFEHVSIT